MMLYSAQNNGFYLPEVHGDAVPLDAVEITEEQHAALIEGQAAGGRIAPGPDGHPILIPAPAVDPIAQEREQMVVSRFQARAALLMADLLDDAEAAVAAADRLTQIAWQDATEFRRMSPSIAALAAGLGLDDAALDDLFRTAMTITA